MAINGLPNSAEPAPIPVAILGEDVASAVYWASIIVEFPTTFWITAVWSQHQSNAEEIARAIRLPKGAVFFDIAEAQENGTTVVVQPLEALLNSRICVGCLVDLPLTLMNSVSTKLCDTKDLHIFSTRFPTYDLSKLRLLLDKFYPKDPFKNSFERFSRAWSMCDFVHYETVMHKLKDALQDIGKVLGAQMTITVAAPIVNRSADVEGEPSESAFSEAVLSSCVSHVSLLRHIFGDVATLNFQHNPGEAGNGESIVGCFSFANDALISVVINQQKMEYFSMTVWGDKGNMSVKMPAGKTRYEFQRCLNHYERPSCHIPSGKHWSVLAWGDSIRSGAPEAVAPLRTYADLALTLAMIHANGSTVKINAMNSCADTGTVKAS